MLIVSISTGDASATAHESARDVICSNNASRSAGGTVFESLSPAMCRSGCSTTAPATTGPARHPRPTSSTPQTRLKPSFRNPFSSVRVAATRVIYGIAGIAERRARGRFPRQRACSAIPTDLFSALAHAGGLALQIAEEVELRSADPRRPNDFHLLNDRRVERENALDPLPERHLPDGERGPYAAPVHA